MNIPLVDSFTRGGFPFRSRSTLAERRMIETLVSIASQNVLVH